MPVLFVSYNIWFFLNLTWKTVFHAFQLKFKEYISMVYGWSIFSSLGLRVKNKNAKFKQNKLENIFPRDNAMFIQ